MEGTLPPERILGGRNSRAVLVDSTRRGKRIPDALSKTVPIWCAVINRAVRVGRAVNWVDELRAPEGSVSAQELAAINMLLPSFLRSFEVPYILYGSDLTCLAMWSGYRVYLIVSRETASTDFHHP
jgi:hypothetical protein